MNRGKWVEHAEVKCKTCGYTRSLNWILSYDAEKRFYETFKPECPVCRGTEWDIREIIETRGPLTSYERELFALAIERGLK